MRMIYSWGKVTIDATSKLITLQMGRYGNIWEIEFVQYKSLMKHVVSYNSLLPDETCAL